MCHLLSFFGINIVFPMRKQLRAIDLNLGNGLRKYLSLNLVHDLRFSLKHGSKRVLKLNCRFKIRISSIFRLRNSFQKLYSSVEKKIMIIVIKLNKSQNLKCGPQTHLFSKP